MTNSVFFWFELGVLIWSILEKERTSQNLLLLIIKWTISNTTVSSRSCQSPPWALSLTSISTNQKSINSCEALSRDVTLSVDFSSTRLRKLKLILPKWMTWFLILNWFMELKIKSRISQLLEARTFKSTDEFKTEFGSHTRMVSTISPISSKSTLEAQRSSWWQLEALSSRFGRCTLSTRKILSRNYLFHTKLGTCIRTTSKRSPT